MVIEFPINENHDSVPYGRSLFEFGQNKSSFTKV